MDDIALLIDLHADGERQGPGGEAETRLAIALSGLSGREDLAIADIGCGTGASTLTLARDLDAHVTGVDFAPDFLARLDRDAEAQGLSDRIATRTAAMEDLPFDEGAFDAIWSEGAIYSMGFARGVAEWRRFLKPGGVLAVSELTWLTQERPPDLTAFWTDAYAEVGTAAEKIAVLEAHGYTPVGYFPLPTHCWLENYYRPLQARFPAFLERHGHSAAATALVANEEREIALYERHRDFVSYGFYIARRHDP